MALIGFLSKSPITIPRTKIGAVTVTDFPLVLVAANFAAEMITAMAANAGDVRFSTDSAGANDIPWSLVHVNQALGELVLRVKVPTLNGTGEAADTVIWAHWNNASASTPANARDVYQGNYYGVFDFDNVVPGWKGVVDSSGQYANCTSNGTITTDDGHIAGLTALEVSASFGINMVELMEMVAEDYFEIQFWSHFLGTYDQGNFILGKNGISVSWAAAGMKFGYSATATEQGAGAGGAMIEPASSWQYHRVTVDNTGSGVVTFWRQGEPDPGYGNSTAPLENMGNFGGNTGCPTFLVSGLKIIRDAVTADAWQPVIYENESNPAAFASSGPVQTVSAGAVLKLTGLQNNTEVRIYDAGTTTELGGEENVTTGVFELPITGGVTSVDIRILSQEFLNIAQKAVDVSAGDVTIPIQQTIDRQYENL